MDKQIVLYPYNGILFNDKKEGPIDSHNKMDKSSMHFAKLKKPDPKDYIYIV